MKPNIQLLIGAESGGDTDKRLDAGGLRNGSASHRAFAAIAAALLEKPLVWPFAPHKPMRRQAPATSRKAAA